MRDRELEEEEDDVLRADSTPKLLRHAGSLENHQLIGLNWMLSLYELGINGILADEMGLGKTIQTIALIGSLKELRKIQRPYLIVAPKSTLGNWFKEFQKWLPSTRVVKLISTRDERNEILNKVLLPEKFDVCLTSYEGINLCGDKLKKFVWQYIIVDEAHRLKNDESLLSRNLRQFKSNFKLLLTGTPLQNNLHELWSLLNFLLPDIFSDSDVFDSWVDMNSSKSELTKEEKDTKNKEMIEKFHKILQPFLLRRTKSETQVSLKPKKEVHLYVGLTECQLNLYKAILLKKNAGDDKKFYMNLLMQLRKVCNHPYLFEGVEEDGAPILGQHVINASGKLLMLDRLLQKLKNDPNDTHQVLIFSQMTRVLDILEDYCNYRSFTYCRIDGETTMDSRDEQIASFTAKNSKQFIFLLSTRAGGLGINLATADTVVLYDSDWNPQVDLQAMDRAHRIGQKKQVVVYRLITEDSVEEKIIERQIVKLRWDHMVIQQGQLQSKAKVMGKDDLKQIVQHGAAAIFRKKVSVSHNNEEDIDALLDRSEQKTSDYMKSVDSHLKTKEPGLSMESINIYKFQDEDYNEKRKNDESALNEEYFKQIEGELKTRREKKQLMMGNAPLDLNGRAKTESKPIKLPEHHFYPNKDRLEELLRKENELKYKSRLVQCKGDRKQGEEAFQLPEDEKSEKEELIRRGFSNWSKNDLNTFISASERHGRGNLEKITESLSGKSVEDIKAYHEVFWERYKELPEWTKIISRIEKGESTITQRLKSQEMINQKCEGYCKPLFEMNFDPAAYGKFKTRFWTFEHDKYLVYYSYKEGFGNWGKIKERLKREMIFIGDHWMMTRDESELSKRMQTLLKVLEKEREASKDKKKSIKLPTKQASEEDQDQKAQYSILNFTQKRPCPEGGNFDACEKKSQTKISIKKESSNQIRPITFSEEGDN